MCSYEIYICIYMYKYIHTDISSYDLHMYIYVQIHTYDISFITSILIKYVYIYRKSINIDFQKYATLPRFCGGQTSGLQRKCLYP